MVHEHHRSASWKTKPSDRFVLKWIKCHLSARITQKLVRFTWLRPWMITASSAGLGVLGGIVCAVGWGFAAGLVVAGAQILDGVDGQFARLTGNNQAGVSVWNDGMPRTWKDSLQWGAEL